MANKPPAKKKPAIPPLLEKDLQAAIRDYLRLMGWYVVKIHQSLGSHRGIADLYAIKNGRHVWIEVKTAKGVLSEHQAAFRDAIEQQGGTYIAARSVDDVIGLKRRI